jgi:hypothetical protein
MNFLLSRATFEVVGTLWVKLFQSTQEREGTITTTTVVHGGFYLSEGATLKRSKLTWIVLYEDY